MHNTSTWGAARRCTSPPRREAGPDQGIPCPFLFAPPAYPATSDREQDYPSTPHIHPPSTRAERAAHPTIRDKRQSGHVVAVTIRDKRRCGHFVQTLE